MDDILQAQQNLGRSLGKARAGEDKELSGRVREAGEALAMMMSGILKMSRVHAADNHAFDQPVAEFVKALQTLDTLVGAVHMVTVDELVYLNDVRLRSEGKAGIQELGVELKKHNVGGMSFHSPLDGKAVRVLIAALAAPPKEPMPRTALREKLHEGGLKSIELLGIFRFRTTDEKAVAKPLGDPTRAEAHVAPGSTAKPGPKAAGKGAPGKGAGPPGAASPSAPAGPGAGPAQPGPVASAAGAAPVTGAPKSAVPRIEAPHLGGLAAGAPKISVPLGGAEKLVAPGSQSAAAAFAKDVFSSDLLAGFDTDEDDDAADASFTSDAAADGAVLEAEVETEPEPEAAQHVGPDVGATPTSAPTMALSILNRLATLSNGAWDALATGRSFSPLPLRRAVAELLELGAETPALWDAWAIGPTRSHHAVTVTLHALLLGHGTELPLAVLQDLGVAALLHDVGYAALVGKPQGAGAEGLARHPGDGVRLLLQQRGFSQAKVRRLRAVLEHHRPQSAADKPSVLGAILHIAEDYASFLRVAGTKTTAVHVLGAMAKEPGALYHSSLMQLFVNAVGKFPPGVVLERADGTRVRVVSPVRSPEQFATPLVRPVDATGKPTGLPMELTAKPPVTKAWPG